MIPHPSRFDGGRGGIIIDSDQVLLELGPIPCKLSSEITIFCSLVEGGLVEWNLIFLYRQKAILSIRTLLALSDWMEQVIACPGTKPVIGSVADNTKGPEAQQKQQKFFSSSSVTGS